MKRLVAAVAFLAACSGMARGADLSGTDRTIIREPAYTSGTPRYCLLVFGPEARAKAWLVLDGDVLYVDRNGNGDLTEPGERVQRSRPGKGSGDDRYTLFLIPGLRLRSGKELFVYVDI